MDEGAGNGEGCTEGACCAQGVGEGAPPTALRRDEAGDLRIDAGFCLQFLRDVRDVAFAIVETTGSLSVYPKVTAQPATAGMLNLQAPPGADAPPVVLIADGVVIDSALGYCNLKYEWLEKTITDNGYTTQDIFLMTCNRQADYLIVPKAQLKLKDRKEDAS